MPTDSADRNKQVIKTLYEECINRKQPELLSTLVSEDFAGPQGARGPSGFGSNIDALRRGFPDVRFTVHDLIADGERIAVRWTWDGTHTGPFQAWAPSGKRVTNSGIAVYELQQGKIVRVWLETDRLGVLQQIGAVPADLVPAVPLIR
jgi:steroid delta-isomerase-like uncharacterized protein